MRIGYSEETLKIILPSQLAGYGDLSSKLNNKEVIRYAVTYDDNLKVKTITIEDKHQLFHIVSIDLLAIDNLILSRVQAHFDKNHILICGTHTHSGPAGLWQLQGTLLNGGEHFLGKTNQKQIDSIVASIVASINRSLENLNKFTYRKFTHEINNVATNRNNPSKLGDNRCTALEFHLENNQKILLVNFACHPTVLDSSSTILDPDIVGEITSQCSEKYNMVSFLNGSAGDISTRHTKSENTKKEAKRLASKLVDVLLEDKFYTEESKLSNIKVFQSSYRALLKKPKPITKLNNDIKDIKEKITKSNNKKTEILMRELSFLEADKNYSLYYEGIEEYEIQINYLMIDELCFVALPLEFNSELSNILKYEFINVRFISYANGYEMYLAEEEAYDKKYYEASNTSFERGEGEKVINHIRNKLIELQI